jgi:hypothetical protein
MKNLDLNEAIVDIGLILYAISVVLIFCHAVFVLHHAGWWFILMLVLLPNRRSDDEKKENR